MNDGLRDIRNELIYCNKSMEALTSELQKTNILLSMRYALELMKDAVNIGAISDETYFNSIKDYLNDVLAGVDALKSGYNETEGGVQNDSAE